MFLYMLSFLSVVSFWILVSMLHSEVVVQFAWLWLDVGVDSHIAIMFDYNRELDRRLGLKVASPSEILKIYPELLNI